MPEAGARKPLRLRPWIRALHRDAGYLGIGLTLVYALSGLAVNHVADWDPNFENRERSYTVATPLPDDDTEAARVVLASGGHDTDPLDVYRADDRLEITLEHSSLHVDLASGRVDEDGQSPRFFLRVANWLHLNRGKQAWTWVADGYAVILLWLAASGLFMLPGRKGLIGRGGLLALLGAAVPVLYVTLSGGP